jgi:hypothetical protein
MTVHRVKIYNKQGLISPDPWCIYAAFSPISDDETYIKIGISTDPLQRGSPTPIKVVLWAYVGKKTHVYAIERRVHRLLADYRTRGEWFAMDLRSPEHKQAFHGTCKKIFAMVTGKQLVWRKNTMEEIMEAKGVILALRRKGG